MQSERDACKGKGRLLPEAYPHATETLRNALAEVNSWDHGRLSDDLVLFRQAQACMRGTYLLALEKLQHLDEVPYLLARLDEPGVRDRCLLQWGEGAAGTHVPVSAEFLQEGSPLRRDLLAMNADGSGMSRVLQIAHESLRQCPIDDTPGEGPHASMRHLGLRTRRSTWGWMASSVRLKQNLQDIKYFLPPMQPTTSVEYLWQKWSSVLQVTPRENSTAPGAWIGGQPSSLPTP